MRRETSRENGWEAGAAAAPAYLSHLDFLMTERCRLREHAPEMLSALNTAHEALLNYERLANDSDEASRRHGEAIRTPLNLAISYVQAACADS